MCFRTCVNTSASAKPTTPTQLRICGALSHLQNCRCRKPPHTCDHYPTPSSPHLRPLARFCSLAPATNPSQVRWHQTSATTKFLLSPIPIRFYRIIPETLGPCPNIPTLFKTWYELSQGLKSHKTTSKTQSHPNSSLLKLINFRLLQ